MGSYIQYSSVEHRPVTRATAQREEHMADLLGRSIELAI
jgi:hypothetical protein